MHFRLWAPNADFVELVLLDGTGGPAYAPMRRGPDGWLALETDQARVGSRYRFRIDGGQHVPDPASRFQPEDVYGPSEVVDTRRFDWSDQEWAGRPWEEAVIYELHVGTFTPDGTFQGVIDKLDHLVDLGITAIELMPLSDFRGDRNWGYDGVLPYAPDSAYGRPEDLKALVDAAHQRGLMVFLDVVYNHFGPDGNHLHTYARPFFTEKADTPWGAAINFDGPHSDAVRHFFVENALYWIEDYHMDGLRLDAVHVMRDTSPTHILREIAQAVKDGPGKVRPVHLILENPENNSDDLRRNRDGTPLWYQAQWNDDFHHALHVALTDESFAYFQDFHPGITGRSPVEHLARCLTEGFAYQGEASPFRGGEGRGRPCTDLPLTSFVSFIQNHDQVGNRAFGERLTTLAPGEAVRAAAAIQLLAPSPPMLFMGEEWGATTPFRFFCDLGPGLAPLVAEGRRKEFARSHGFDDPALWEAIPDPSEEQTFLDSRLDWHDLDQPEHRARLRWYRQLLAIRGREIAPRLKELRPGCATWEKLGPESIRVTWWLGNVHLGLWTNLSGSSCPAVGRVFPNVLHASHPESLHEGRFDELPPWSVVWAIH